jgi:hypothetical protein
MYENSPMKTNTSAPDYKGYRFPPEIISHTVWLSFRFSLSLRDVEELMLLQRYSCCYDCFLLWSFLPVFINMLLLFLIDCLYGIFQGPSVRGGSTPDGHAGLDKLDLCQV